MFKQICPECNRVFDMFNSLDVEEFYDLSSWEIYRNYLSSNLADQTSRPPDWLIKFSEFGSISLDRMD